MKPGQLKFGYGTNGFAHHRLPDALRVIANLGYEGVALTLDHCHLDPFARDLFHRVSALVLDLERLGLSVVVETGAGYLLDPWRKNSPTLLEPGRDKRIAFLVKAVAIAADLGAGVVSFGGGVVPGGLPGPLAWDYLAEGCEKVLAAADASGVRLGFEPRPDMLAADLDGYDRLAARLGDPERFGLALDIGHCRCAEPQPVAECVRRAGQRLVHVQLDDRCHGGHENLELGHGEIDFPPVLDALAQIGYRGLVAVELPRHSHIAPVVARESLDFLRRATSREAIA
jgi:L-ribulose-5-phosphate 3-epimerase